MKSANKIFLATTAILLLLVSCKKDEAIEEGPDVMFTTAINAYTVTFTNNTQGSASYKWDFGDGTTSTEKSPVHIYPGKGKYVPTLTVSMNGKNYEGSTVLRISKSSAVKLNDNSFTDWDTVRNSVTYPTGYFRRVKLDYDAENVYFYFEVASTVAAADIFDFYLDTDNNASTGLLTWVSTGGGNDVLLEGQMLAPTGQWFEMFYHTGPQTAFSFTPQPVTDFYAVGTVQQAGPILKFEGKLVRPKIKGLTGTGLKIAGTSTKNDWSATLGIFPAAGAPAMYINMAD